MSLPPDNGSRTNSQHASKACTTEQLRASCTWLMVSLLALVLLSTPLHWLRSTVHLRRT